MMPRVSLKILHFRRNWQTIKRFITAFFNKCFSSSKEEMAFKADLKAAVAELKKKVPNVYSVEVSPGLID